VGVLAIGNPPGEPLNVTRPPSPRSRTEASIPLWKRNL